MMRVSTGRTNVVVKGEEIDAIHDVILRRLGHRLGERKEVAIKKENAHDALRR
jgi:hypothetical protein